MEGGVKLFLQQDVRLFGEELHTLSDYRADNLDLHQGFLELGSVPLVGGSLRIGRQEMAGEQRLIGTVDWAQQGRSFDGGRYTSRGFGGVSVDLFAMKLQENTSPNHPVDGELHGAWADPELGGGGSLGAWGLVTTDNRPAGTDEVPPSSSP